MYYFKMSGFVVLLILGLVSFEQMSYTSGYSRQKRCIVIQKQSGTHGDSTEGEDERVEKPKDRPENHHNQRHGSRHDLQDTEEITPEFLKYKLGQTKKISELYRLKNKLKAYKMI